MYRGGKGEGFRLLFRGDVYRDPLGGKGEMFRFLLLFGRWGGGGVRVLFFLK